MRESGQLVPPRGSRPAAPDSDPECGSDPAQRAGRDARICASVRSGISTSQTSGGSLFWAPIGRHISLQFSSNCWDSGLGRRGHGEEDVVPKAASEEVVLRTLG